jgi:processive 1,2-diacylglycerol beta-glucosyltransferase
VDVYVVPAEEVKQRFVVNGVAPDRVRVYGIPVDPHFLDPVDRQAVAQQFGLDPNQPGILVMGGGGGFGPLRELMQSLDRVPVACQFVVLAGTNQALLSWFRQQRFQHRVLANGYVDSVPQLMSLATLIITKPGGLTTAESLAMGLPLLIVTPIPGQEMCNARYLLSQRAAVQLNAPREAGEVVTAFLSNPERLAQLRARAKPLAYPDSALQSARLLIELADRVRPR